MRAGSSLIVPPQAGGGGGGSSITVVGLTQLQDQNGPSARDLTLPPGTVAGNQAIVVALNSATGADTAAPSSPAMTERYDSAIANLGRLFVWTKDTNLSSADITAGKISPTFSPWEWTHAQFALITCSGLDLTAPLDATPVGDTNTGVTTDPTTMNFPDITPGHSGSLILRIATCYSSVTVTWGSTPSGLTQMLNTTDPSTSRSLMWIGRDTTPPSGGVAAGAKSITVTSYQRKNSVSIAFKAA